MSFRSTRLGLALGGASLIAVAAFAQDGTELRGPEAFADMADERDRAAAIFAEMGKVLTHPRCVNCHPAGDRPLQGDEMVLHQPMAMRGPAGFGTPGMRCGTCHGAENVAYSTHSGSIPGHEKWHLAPLETAWEGRTLAQICEQIKDPERNGGMSLAELVEHNAHDGLVGWGWEPGEGRTPAPGSQRVFGALTEAWVEAGAHCPQD